MGTGPGVIQVDGYVPSYTPKQRNSPQNQGYNTYQKRPDSGSPRTQRHNFQGQQGGRLSPQSQQNQQPSPQSSYQQQNSFQQQKNKSRLSILFNLIIDFSKLSFYYYVASMYELGYCLCSGVVILLWISHWTCKLSVAC